MNYEIILEFIRMPAPGEHKRRKKTKNPLRWIKEKIIDPVLDKLKPLVRKFLKTKFGSSVGKFAAWLNEKVIQQDKYGLMSAIRSVVPGGVYLEQALKIAGNLVEKADYDAIGRFIESLVFKSDRQEETIDEYAKSVGTEEKVRTMPKFMKVTRQQDPNEPAKQTIRIERPRFDQGLPSRVKPQVLAQRVDDDDEDEGSAGGTDQSVAQRIFGKPMN